jgi:hypothetical protein
MDEPNTNFNMKDLFFGGEQTAQACANAIWFRELLPGDNAGFAECTVSVKD